MKGSALSTNLHLKAVSLFVVSLFIMGLCGCSPVQRTTFRGRPTSKNGHISKEELREALNNFEDVLRATISEASIELDENISASKTRKINLLWRARVTRTYHTVLEMEDPVAAFVEAWALCVRLTQYLEEGEGSKLYGEYQKVAIDAAKKMELEIENIGRTFIDEETLAETQKHVAEFATANPVRGTYSNLLVRASKVKKDQSNPFMDVLNIPMSPFRAIEGVDRGVVAIDKFRGTADQFSDVVEGLPESARWQLLLLLYDMEETEMTKSFLASMSQFSESSAKLAETTKNLPKEIREQTSILVEEIDNKQANLQATLDKAQKTIAAAEQVLIQVDKTNASFLATAVEVRQIVTTWDKAAKSTQQALSEFSKLKPTPKDPRAEPAFKIKDVHDIVEAVNQTIGEMQNLTVEIRDLVESKQLADYASMPERFVNLLVWRLGQLIAIVLVLALVYRVAIVRIKKEKIQGK